ncbi:MAG: hypothetical protein ACI97A_004076 [Planctomycetota bacterium]|jgi:hypothetical protein
MAYKCRKALSYRQYRTMLSSSFSTTVLRQMLFNELPMAEGLEIREKSMQRKMSEKLVLVFPGLLLAVGLAFLLLFHLEDQARDGDVPTFERYLTAEVSPEVGPDERAAISPATSIESGGRKVAAPSPEWARSESLVNGIPERHEYQVTIIDENYAPVKNAKIRLVERSRLYVDNAKQSKTLLGDLAVSQHQAGENGVYSFVDKNYSKYEIEVDVPGYAKKRYRLVDPGKKTIRLVREASIVGTVYDANGAPVPAIDVQIWHDLNSKEVVKTDENGSYHFKSVTPSSATLRINSPRFRRVQEHRIKMDGRTAYEQNFHLTPGGELVVKVKDADGEIAIGAFVALKELDTGLEFRSVLTDQKGEATFNCLEAHCSYMVVGKSGVSTGRVFVAKDSNGNASEASIQLQRAKTFFGVVQIENSDDLPIGGVEITFESTLTRSNAEQHQVRVVSDENGAFEVQGLDPNLDYTAFLFHPSYAFAVQENIKSELAQVEGFESNRTSQAEAPQVFSMGEPSRFDGLVLGKDGLPVSRGYITLDNSRLDVGVTGSRFSVRPDSTGRFSFSNLGSGSYDLTIRDLTTGDVSQRIRIVVGNGVVELENVGTIVDLLQVDLAKN